MKGNLRRINYDLHNSLGFWLTLPMLVMALTGLCWSFSWYRNSVSALIGTNIFGGRFQKPEIIKVVDLPKVELSTLINRTNDLLDYKGNISLSIPSSSDQAIAVSKYPTGFMTIRGRDKLHFNPYTGELVKSDLFSNKAFNKQFASLIRSLHTGDFMGGLSKLIYFLGCLVATSLPISGFFIWFWKKKSKRRRRA